MRKGEEQLNVIGKAGATQRDDGSPSPDSNVALNNSKDNNLQVRLAKLLVRFPGAYGW